MRKTVELDLKPSEAADRTSLENAARAAAGLPEDEVVHVEVLRRSIDARHGRVRVKLRVDVFCGEPPPEPSAFRREYGDVSGKPPLLIVGCGPAGLFAALRAIEAGRRPVILEKGKPIQERRRDVAKLNREHVVNPRSNYCFGEGGAGAFSDGKLVTRSKKRGSTQEVLETLVAHGAPRDILVDAQPHIGTDKLPGIITSIRGAIEKAGGEVHFDAEVSDILVDGDAVRGVATADGREWPADRVILATGHSARDIYTLLHRKGIAIEAKDFAIGVRVEHPQERIDRIQYGEEGRGEFLPPAAYRVAVQVGGRGVYSFCMCPGGVIAPCATTQKEIVTNGWSPASRSNPYANAGIVVQIRTADVHGSDRYPLAMMEYQSDIEHTAWNLAGQRQTAPALRLMDMIRGRISHDLPDCSYAPGLAVVDLADVLPAAVMTPLREGLLKIGGRLRGFLTNEAVAVGVESRTSSPVRIPRDPETLQHVQLPGLYPCGEGAGYAGGIVSAAIDGARCAASACS
jgi:uncharacterized FAD-dependent dehydrogenase